MAIALRIEFPGTVCHVTSRDNGKQAILMDDDKESPWETLKGQIFWATDGFIKQLSSLLDEKGNIKEVPRLQGFAARSL